MSKGLTPLPVPAQVAAAAARYRQQVVHLLDQLKSPLTPAQNAVAILGALSAAWVEFAVHGHDLVTTGTDEDRALFSKARAVYANQMWAIGGSASPDLAADAMGWVKPSKHVLLLHPDGRSEEATITEGTDHRALLGLSKSAYVEIVPLPDRRLLAFSPQRGEVNVEATKLLRSVKPASVAIRGCALVTRDVE